MFTQYKEELTVGRRKLQIPGKILEACTIYQMLLQWTNKGVEDRGVIFHVGSRREVILVFGRELWKSMPLQDIGINGTIF